MQEDSYQDACLASCSPDIIHVTNSNNMPNDSSSKEMYYEKDVKYLGVHSQSKKQAKQLGNFTPVPKNWWRSPRPFFKWVDPLYESLMSFPGNSFGLCLSPHTQFLVFSRLSPLQEPYGWMQFIGQKIPGKVYCFFWYSSAGVYQRS